MVGNLKPYLRFVLISIFMIAAASATHLSVAPTPPSVYDILPQFGLPKGLLPDSVKSYLLSETGEFKVVLDGPCYIQFDYLVYYDATITGTLKYGSITNLKGIEVQRFLIWFDVDEIKVDLPPSDNIYFQVGLINKKLDVDQFQTVHSCRNGVSSACSGGSSKQPFDLEILDPVEWTKEME